MAAVGAFHGLSLVLAVEYAVTHVYFIELFVKVLICPAVFFAKEFPKGLADHQCFSEIGFQCSDSLFCRASYTFGAGGIL